jgi:hypothetical protein
VPSAAPFFSVSALIASILVAFPALHSPAISR